MTTRDYESSHPWLTFSAGNVEQFGIATWRMLGEAESKIEHIAGVPLPPDVAQRLHVIYLAKGASATTQIEGNTLTEEQVLELIQSQRKLPPSQAYLQAEIDNVIEACNLIADDMLQGRSLRLTPERICEFNRLVLKDLPPEEGVIPGEIRTGSVVVGGGIYRGAPAQDCAYLLDRLCSWMDDLERECPAEYRMSIAIVSAIVAHLYLAWIHPFGNGNGRTARLVEFQLLARAGAPTPAAHLLSNHYNATRTRYYQVLNESSRVKPYSVSDFVRYAVEGFVDGLREQIGFVQAAQRGIIWTSIVNDLVSDDADGRYSPTADRQRLLVLSLQPDVATPISKIPELNGPLARLYADKTSRTVSRDVNKLVGLGLLHKDKTVVWPAVEQMEAFLPPRVREETTQGSGPDR